MQLVYVQNKDGTPLMPCKPAKAKHLLRDKKAKVVNLSPFVIRLNWNCENNTQEVIVGLDTGAVNVGCSAVSEEKVLFASEIKLRTDIHKKMQRRATYRRNRRTRKTRYRKPRFKNRTRPSGWLPPSLKSKANSMVKVVNKLSEIVPVSKVLVEKAKFDIQKLKNPEIKGKGYQNGNLKGYNNVRAYVFERDKYTCQICKKFGGRIREHHIIPRKDGGSDSPDNLVTVHVDCHDKFHKGEIKHKFKKPKQYRHQTHVTTLKDFVVSELKKDFNVKITFGYITKENRNRLGLEKTHYNDAISICNPEDVKPIDGYYQFVCRPHGRYKLTQGERSQQYLPTKRVFGYDVGDKVVCRKTKKQIGFIEGKMSTGYFIIGDIHNKTTVKCTSYKFLELLQYGQTINSQFIPQLSQGDFLTI